MPSSRRSSTSSSFGAFLAARSISIVGDRFNDLAIPILVLGATGSATDAGLVGAANRLPSLLLAVWVGSLVDRSSRRRLMLVADFGRAAVLLVLAGSLLIGSLSLPLLIAVMFFVGIGDVLFFSSSGAFMVGLVGRSRLVEANGQLEAADAAATLTGPALGALVLQVAGATATIEVNALSFLVSGLLIRRIDSHTSDRVRSSEPLTRTTFSRADLLAGFRLMVGLPQQRTLQLALGLLNLLAGGITLLVIALARDVLDLDPLGVGFVLAGAGVGGLLSSLLIAPRIDHLRWGRALGTLILIAAGAIGMLATADRFITALIANVALDGTVALAFVVAGAARQALTPDHLLGRVGSAAFLLNTLAATVGVLLAGFTISGLGERDALIAIGVAAAIAGCAMWGVRSAQVPLSELRPIPAS